MDAIIGLSLDRSGSMTSMWEEAVNGFNTFKNEQAEQDGHAWIILNYFDNDHGQKYFAWDAKHIPDLRADDTEIFPRGMTALLDSTVRTINDTQKWIVDNPDFDGKVFVVVITDGMENASETAPASVKELIAQKESDGWEFIYLAANVDTDATARQYGFAAGQSMTYDASSVGLAYTGLSNAVTRSRSGGDVSFTPDEKDVRSGA